MKRRGRPTWRQAFQDPRDDHRGSLEGWLTLVAWVAGLVAVGSCERVSAAAERPGMGIPATPAACSRIYDAGTREVQRSEDALVAGYEARDAGDPAGWARWIGTAEALLGRAEKLRKMRADCLRSLPRVAPVAARKVAAR